MNSETAARTRLLVCAAQHGWGSTLNGSQPLSFAISETSSMESYSDPVYEEYSNNYRELNGEFPPLDGSAWRTGMVEKIMERRRQASSDQMDYDPF
jgi:hypothetical protein